MKLIENIVLMNKIAQNRRKLRIENGSLTIDKKVIRFNLDENGCPISYRLE